ncbi:nucleoside deaminase [Virgibacillus sp. W0430]|uniref:nucleoside deaminase n=1 Tax=Virgibacillus sp. W0430 TaxID=3391580 RepID=UPI003F453807
MDKFMRRAVEISANNVREGGEPFGAVLVKDGEIVAEGVNELHKKFDVSGHAEMVAIRKAQEKLQTHDLSEFTMYASGEPCPMCLTTMYMSGMKHAYYCASIEDTAAAGLGASKIIYADLAKPREERSLKMEHMPLEKGQEDPMALYVEKKQA